MDFNSDVNRKQAITKSGDLRYSHSYSKVTQNWVVKNIPEEKHCNYLPSIMQEIVLQKSLVENLSQTTGTTDVPVNIAPFEKTCKKKP